MLSEVTDKNFFARFKTIFVFLSLAFNVVLLTYILMGYNESGSPKPAISDSPSEFHANNPVTPLPSPPRNVPPATTAASPPPAGGIRNLANKNTQNEMKNINEVLPRGYPSLKIVMNADRTKHFEMVMPVRL